MSLKLKWKKPIFELSCFTMEALLKNIFYIDQSHISFFGITGWLWSSALCFFSFCFGNWEYCRKKSFSATRVLFFFFSLYFWTKQHPFLFSPHSKKKILSFTSSIERTYLIEKCLSCLSWISKGTLMRRKAKCSTRSNLEITVQKKKRRERKLSSPDFFSNI